MKLVNLVAPLLPKYIGMIFFENFSLSLIEKCVPQGSQWMQSSLDSSETMPCRTVGKESGLDPTSSSKDDGDGENSSLLMEKRSTSSGSWILKLDSIMMVFN